MVSSEKVSAHNEGDRYAGMHTPERISYSLERRVFLETAASFWFFCFLLLRFVLSFEEFIIFVFSAEFVSSPRGKVG